MTVRVTTWRDSCSTDYTLMITRGFSELTCSTLTHTHKYFWSACVWRYHRCLARWHPDSSRPLGQRRALHINFPHPVFFPPAGQRSSNFPSQAQQASIRSRKRRVVWKLKMAKQKPEKLTRKHDANPSLSGVKKPSRASKQHGALALITFSIQVYCKITTVGECDVHV